MCVDRPLPKAYYSHLLVYQMLPETYENVNFMTLLAALSISTEYTLTLVSVVDERDLLPVLTSIPWCSGQMEPAPPGEGRIIVSPRRCPSNGCSAFQLWQSHPWSPRMGQTSYLCNTRSIMHGLSSRHTCSAHCCLDPFSVLPACPP